MARKRIHSTPGIQAKILAGVGRGDTDEQIAQALAADGIVISRPTIARRRRELEGMERKSLLSSKPSGPAPRTPVAASLGAGELALPEDPEAIPEGTAVETYDLWLERCEAMYLDAKSRADFDGVLKAGRLKIMFQEGKRKATPIPKDDPNDHPDMIALGAKVAERLHKLIDQVKV